MKTVASSISLSCKGFVFMKSTSSSNKSETLLAFGGKNLSSNARLHCVNARKIFFDRTQNQAMQRKYIDAA
jgi:hypothetical protein